MNNRNIFYVVGWHSSASLQVVVPGEIAWRRWPRAFSYSDTAASRYWYIFRPDFAALILILRRSFEGMLIFSQFVTGIDNSKGKWTIYTFLSRREFRAKIEPKIKKHAHKTQNNLRTKWPQNNIHILICNVRDVFLRQRNISFPKKIMRVLY